MDLTPVFPRYYYPGLPDIPELVNLQNVNGQAKPYQVRQLLRLIERYNLQMEEEQ